MTDKTCTTCGRAISMERGLPDNGYWEIRASSNVFCKATGIMMATADCAPLCQGKFWIEKQEEPQPLVRCRTCADYMQGMSHAQSPTERRCRRLKRWVEPDDFCSWGKGAKVVDDE